MTAFGAIEIPVGVPAADQTLAILAKIDEKAQAVGQHSTSSFGQARDALGRFTAGAGAAAGAAEGFGDANLRAAEAATHHSITLGRVERSFESFIVKATGANEQLGLLAAAFGHLEVGSVVMLGALAGIFALVKGWELYTAEGRAAEKTTDDALKKLGELRDKQREGKFGDLHPITNQARDDLNDLNRQVAAKRLEIAAAGRPSGSRTDNAGARLVRQQELTQELHDLERQATDVASRVHAGEKGIQKVTAEIADEAARKAHEAREKEIRDRALDYDLYRAQTKHSLDTQLVLQDDWIAELKRKYPQETDTIKQALVKRAEIVSQISAKELEDQKRVSALIHEDQAKEQEEFYAQMRHEIEADNAARAKLREKDLQHQRAVAQESQQLARETAGVIGETMRGLLSGDIGGGITALTDGILKMLGDLFVKIGERMLAASGIFESLAGFLANPFSPGAGIGMAVGGAALIALGSAMGASGGGSHGGGASHSGGSGYNYGQVITGTVTPHYNAPNTSGVTAKTPINLTVNAFGKHDPTFQRELLEAIAVAQRRGSTSG